MRPLTLFYKKRVSGTRCAAFGSEAALQNFTFICTTIPECFPMDCPIISNARNMVITNSLQQRLGGGNPFYASLYIERSYLTEEELQYLMTAPLHHLHQYPLRGHQLLYLASERK